MKTIVLRSALIVMTPIILTVAFVGTLIRGIRDAFVYAWLEVRIELSSFADAWNFLDERRERENAE
ncbi:MAG: hypothetical protein C4523_10590 [Myxococcales bacterium]|jgi:hypothetical protein|nr:MAG: hypothetical protein C4523_10590 [Myxococcales bacterium]